MRAIHKVAVIGAGTMGAGIAAHLANAGLEVVLLDLNADLAASAVARQLRVGGFMDPAFARRVQTASVQTDLGAVADADWIIEAVAERADIKRDLFARLQTLRKRDSIVSSNTSTIPLSALLAGLPQEFAQDFLITHFFNPPRRMRLLEVVVGPATAPDAAASIRDLVDRRLGKGVVFAKDTPGFIANRIGVYWMATAEHEAIRLGLDVEEADALISRPFGIPSTGIFGLLDLIGIDLMPAVLGSLVAALPAEDRLAEYSDPSPVTVELIRTGRTGRKAGAGFARLAVNNQREVLDLKTGQYRAQRPVAPETLAAAMGDPRSLMEQPGAGGVFVSTVMEKTLAYAASLVPEIADTPASVDEALRLGFGWQWGPFELVDRLGPAWLIGRLEARGLPVPPFLAEAARFGEFYGRADAGRTCLAPGVGPRRIAPVEGIISLADLKLASSPVETDPYAALWDMGDGVGLIEVHAETSIFDSKLLSTLQRLLIRTKRDFQAAIIGGDGWRFGAEADLRALAESGEDRLSEVIGQGQAVSRWIKFSPLPVVAVATGRTFSGGCELALHCSAIQADAEVNLGLLQTIVGLIPAWGGCKEMLLRFSQAGSEPVDAALAAFDLIRKARASSSAFEARALGYLRASDEITMNRDRLLADAKVRALSLAAGYVPRKPRTLALSGAAGADALREALNADRDERKITAHAHAVESALIRVLTGGPSADPSMPVSENAIFALEREAFLALFALPPTQERIRLMLEPGKPLRQRFTDLADLSESMANSV